MLEEIADVAGRPTAIAMALAWGGREVHIPKPRHLARHPDHPLARLLEAEGTALRVSDYLGGSSVYLPRARRACAVHLAAAGATAVEIAARLSLSPSAARRYMRRPRRRRGRAVSDKSPERFRVKRKRSGGRPVHECYA